jgi:hypothetical protein
MRWQTHQPFPKAREAELNLARGVGVVGPAPLSSLFLDVPLGGDEAVRRNGTNDDDVNCRAGNVGAVGKYNKGGVLSSSF